MRLFTSESATDEDKLAAIIVLLDPFERAPKSTSDEAGCPAFEAVRKIRAVLDAPTSRDS